MAQDLGANGWQVYRDAIWPGIRASVHRVFIFIFVLCFSTYSIPLLLASSEYYTPDVMMANAWQAGETVTALSYLVMRFCIVVFVLFLPQKK
jgi:ABC-type Fe3+ transport system permease subunit